jgi:hypothetical protein
MHLRQTRVIGRSFSPGAQPLAHVCTVCACGKKTRRGPSARLPGAGVWRHAWGDGAHCPSGRHGAKYRSLNHQSRGLQIVQQNIKFSGARLFQNSGSSPTPPRTITHNFKFSVAVVSAGSLCSVASFEVNSEPHPGHVSRSACVWG